MILFLKLFSTIHLCSVLPIICYIVRIQIFGTFFYNPYPSKLHIIVYSIIVLVLSILVLYIAYNSLGVLLGIVGATFGFILMYFIPIGINLIYYRRKHPPMNMKIFQDLEALSSKEDYNNSSDDVKLRSTNTTDMNKSNDLAEKEHSSNYAADDNLNINSNQVNTDKREKLIEDFQKNVTNNKELELKDRYIYTGKERSMLKDYCFYFLQFFMLAIGFITMLFQFVNWNMFNVHLDS